MKITRKEFIKKAGLYCTGIYSISILAGCSSSAGQISQVMEQNDGQVMVENKKLKNTGDSVIVEVKNFPSKIILIKTGSNEYKALSLMCSHKGCELVVNKKFFECPCHGSEFDIDGNVLKGPASESLVKFKTKSNNNSITIFVNEYE